jgi:GTP pyrophosphokinase
VGARVNGELVPLRHELRNGDTVEIITSPQAQPHEDWLQIVKTAGARTKIRHWLRQRRHDDSVTLGREMVDRECKRMRIKPDDKALEEVARALGCTDLDQMYGRLGEGQLSLTQVVRKLAPEKEGFAERLAKGPLEALGLGRKATGGVSVGGIDNVMLSFARCCQPVPGDRVIGIVTAGRGVSVHRQDCPNTFADRVPAERKVAVEWDAKIGEMFPVRLVVYGHDRRSLLADIAKAIAAIAVNIRSAGMASEDQTARGVFVVEVPHLARLQEVITAVRRVKGVTRVERRQRFLRSSPPPSQRASGDE